MLAQTEVDKAYAPNQYFVTANAVKQSEKIEAAVPAFCARADGDGRFVIAAVDAEDGVCHLLRQDGSEILCASYQAGGWVLLQ